MASSNIIIAMRREFRFPEGYEWDSSKADKVICKATGKYYFAKEMNHWNSLGCPAGSHPLPVRRDAEERAIPPMPSFAGGAGFTPAPPTFSHQRQYGFAGGVNPAPTASAYQQPMGPPAAPARPSGPNYFVSNLSQAEYERRTKLVLENCKLDLSNIPAPCRLEDRFETWQIPPEWRGGETGFLTRKEREFFGIRGPRRVAPRPAAPRPARPAPALVPLPDPFPPSTAPPASSHARIPTPPDEHAAWDLSASATKPKPGQSLPILPRSSRLYGLLSPAHP